MAYSAKYVPQSAIAVPLIAQGRTMGSLLLVRHASPRPFTADDLDLVKQLTDRAAIALTTAREHQDLQEERQRLRARTEELQAVMAATPAAIWVAHDPEGRRITGNPESYRILRMNDGTNVSKTAPADEPPQKYRVEREGRELPATELPLQRAARGWEVRNVQFDLVFEDGLVRTMFGSALPLLADDGRPPGSVGAFVDVAPLRDAIKARDEFLSVASHELKTPLTSLELYIDSILRAFETGRIGKMAPEALAERLAKASAQSRRLTSLINQLLDVSRIDNRRLAVQPEEVDLAEMVGVVADRFQEQAEAAGSPLCVHPQRVVGRWDKNGIDQVITNLVSNAVKYGRGQPIDISVGQSGDRGRLTVVDRGIGIAAEDQTRIFDRFERAVPAAHFGGIGLGLWIVKNVVDAHQGTISLESSPQRGSTFVVELPLAPVADKA
jgi:signal transduction histidine kinase